MIDGHLMPYCLDSAAVWMTPVPITHMEIIENNYDRDQLWGLWLMKSVQAFERFMAAVDKNRPQAKEQP